VPQPMTREQIEEGRDAVLRHGSISAAAKALGIPRAAVQRRIRKADAEGMLERPRAEANPSRWRPGAEIVAARKAEFARVRAAAPDNHTVIHLADDKPFMLVALGDPHLDNPGTDLDLWEKWIELLDYREGRYGIGMGDWLDNWLRVLSHLYATAETTAPEGFILLEYYLDKIGEHLIASVAGKHDDWVGHSDVLAMLMARHGVRHRSKSLRVVLRTPAAHEVSLHLRHRWTGRSMWNEVHALKRAARMGVRDNILLGGDLHVSGDSIEKDPMTGALTFCYQVASFKMIDDYADDKGFLDRHVAPAVALVVDPTLPVSDPDRVRHFYTPDRAKAYLEMLRGGGARKARRAR
jgi:DNA-binding Lrp family transcriptional regulator